MYYFPIVIMMLVYASRIAISYDTDAWLVRRDAARLPTAAASTAWRRSRIDVIKRH